MLWYHDHAMGINRLNIYAGMFGLFLCAMRRRRAESSQRHIRNSAGDLRPACCGGTVSWIIRFGRSRAAVGS